MHHPAPATAIMGAIGFVYMFMCLFAEPENTANIFPSRIKCILHIHPYIMYIVCECAAEVKFI